MKVFRLFLSVPFACAYGASNLAITPAQNGTDHLWISYMDESDTGFLMRYSGTQFDTWRAFPNISNGCISSTITLDPSGGMHLIVSVDNTLLSVDPFEEMATVDSAIFPDYAEWYIAGLLRRSKDPSWGLLGRYMVTYMSSGAEFDWITREYTVSETGMITMGDSLILTDPYPVEGSDYPCYLVHNLVNPVMNATGFPVMAERQGKPGGPMPPAPSSWYISSQCHNTAASPVFITADTLTWSTDESTAPELLASGSNEAEALFIWSDSTGTVYFSIHDCFSGFTSTQPFPGQGPSSLNAAAMSANPSDQGLLLVWQNGVSLYCRHYENGWNDHAHLIKSGVAPLAPGDIGVCSVEDGYWVAYRDAFQPALIFVERGNVTEIFETSRPIDPLAPRVYPNPFSSSLSVTIPEAGFIHAALYNGAGRMVMLSTGEETLVMDTSRLPAGSYVLRVTSSSGFHREKVVLVR